MSRRRLLLFLYSTSNLVGLVLALVGLVLYFTGVVGALWPLVVVGLYLAGVLLTPRPRRSVLSGGSAATTADIRRSLDRLDASLRGGVPDDVAAAVARVRQDILVLLPDDDVDVGDDPGLVLVRVTALEYLPSTLQNYLDLPRAYANLHPVKDGKTAHQLLLDQLELLDTKMREVADDVHRQDTRRLIQQGYFLEERFKMPDAGTGAA
jgi:hypothetical protein